MNMFSVFKSLDRTHLTISLKRITGNLEGYVTSLGSNIAKVIRAVASVVIVLFVIFPFVLFYLLKEGDKAPAFLLKFVPAKQQEEGLVIVSDMDNRIKLIPSGANSCECMCGYFVLNLVFEYWT